jgi:hypothetical protein
MDKVPIPWDSECHTQSSEDFTLYLDLGLKASGWNTTLEGITGSPWSAEGAYKYRELALRFGRVSDESNIIWNISRNWERNTYPR